MSTLNQHLINTMRDCVKQSLEKGARSKREFKDMRYGIICELKQNGLDKATIEATMKDWVDKSYQKLTYKKFSQQIKSFIDWAFKKDAKVGCASLKKKGFCIPDCKFKERRRIEANATLSQEAIYLEDEIRKFLTDHAKCKHPSECAAIYKIIDRWRVGNGLTRSHTVFIALREIKDAFWKRGYGAKDTMEISRLVNELQDSDLVEIKRGKSGEFKGEANGYKLLTPDDVLKEDLTSFNDEVIAHP